MRCLHMKLKPNERQWLIWDVRARRSCRGTGVREAGPRHDPRGCNREARESRVSTMNASHTSLTIYLLQDHSLLLIIGYHSTIS